ncbi:MAG: GNAT family protein [Acidimicrobiales bacterium]
MMGRIGTTRVTTNTGLAIELRGPSEDDRDILQQEYRLLSDRSRYSRFFTVSPHLTESTLTSLLSVDQQDHIAVGAVVDAPDGEVAGRTIGVARAIRLNGRHDAAELAVTVVDDYQRQGVGTTLICAVAAYATTVGIDVFTATLLAGNAAMAAVLRGFGARLEPNTDDRTLIEATLDTSIPAGRLDPDLADRIVQTLRSDLAT